MPGLTAGDVERLVDERTAHFVNTNDAERLIAKRVREVFTPEEIWKTVESRLQERLGLFKLLIYMVSGVIAVLGGFILSMVADSNIRSLLVSKWIFNLSDELKKEESIKVVDKLLDNEIISKKIETAFDKRFQETMKHVVAYSYSTTFLLGMKGGLKPYHVLTFYKTEDDSGRLVCTAIYPPDENVRNGLSVSWNDKGTTDDFKFDLDDNKRATLDESVPKKPDDLFGRGAAHKVLQRATFRISDYPDFDRSVSVACTMLIVGPTRYYEVADQ